ncbi:MAG: hypothetical protein RL154_461 [Pseudomonadota bacterium]|jgi:hypothetical protein
MDITVLVKTFLDYGVLGAMVWVLMYAVRKLGLLMLDDKKDVEKIGSTLNSLTILVDSLEKQYSFMFNEYKSMLEFERSRTTDLSEKYLLYVSTLDKEMSQRYSDQIGLLTDIKTALLTSGAEHTNE